METLAVPVLRGGGGAVGGLGVHRPVFRTQSSPASTSLTLPEKTLSLPAQDTSSKPRFTTGESQCSNAYSTFCVQMFIIFRLGLYNMSDLSNSWQGFSRWFHKLCAVIAGLLTRVSCVLLNVNLYIDMLTKIISEEHAQLIVVNLQQWVCDYWWQFLSKWPSRLTCCY